MSETEQISADQQPEAEVENAVEADNKSKPVKKVSGKGVDPVDKFAGDGVVFRAKLFGTADVREPRGDLICATAMNLLKSAVKTTGEHKQKILLKINLNGIVLVDALTQTKLYEHSVNKISFIAKDPTDNRAFGFIIGEKDGAHMYFGIKSERAAEQVVLTLKDLFQTVFEMKRKEAEMKGKTPAGADTAQPSVTQQSATQPPATAETTSASPNTQQTPAATSPQPASTPAPVQEPSLGDVTDSVAKPEVKRQDSQSHLLDLLDNLSFATPAPAPASMNGQFGQQPAMQAGWGNAVGMTAAPGWGNSAPVQNDPFATASSSGMFAQQQQFSQTPGFPPQNQQAAQPQFQANFNQPNAMPVHYNQQPFNQPQQTQPNPFNMQPNAGAFPIQQPPMNGSPFASTTPASQQAPFTADPFATGFQANAQQPAASNPFSGGGNEAFGVLQPQQVVQPSSQAVLKQGAAPGNLFSDLNPLPGTNNNTRKDQFFSETKNPPKPKLNELQPNMPSQQPSANPNNPFAMPYQLQPLVQPVSQPVSQLDLDWLENQSGSAPSNQSEYQPSVSNSTTATTTPPAKQGLLPPPPSSARQRISNNGQSAVIRPH